MAGVQTRKLQNNQRCSASGAAGGMRRITWVAGVACMEMDMRTEGEMSQECINGSHEPLTIRAANDND
jgi:hypothetical protein